MSEHLFLLLNPLILRSSLLLSELWRDNLRKTKRRFTKKNTQSPPEPGCSGLIENGRALAIISPSFPHNNYKTQCSPLSRRVALKGIRLDLEWKAAAQNVSTVTKKKWFIWEHQRDATSIPRRGSGAGRSHQIRLRPALGGGRDCCCNWKQKQSEEVKTQEVKSNVEAFVFER